ncbi:MAG: hypothetical protein K0S47_980 [Herbinix sp.]|jgi:hypothetical protein|nr:hypothetical protein [Herbinix sp.]
MIDFMLIDIKVVDILKLIECYLLVNEISYYSINPVIILLVI